jgi:hypothetical protein
MRSLRAGVRSSGSDGRLARATAETLTGAPPDRVLLTFALAGSHGDTLTGNGESHIMPDPSPQHAIGHVNRFLGSTLTFTGGTGHFAAVNGALSGTFASLRHSGRPGDGHRSQARHLQVGGYAHLPIQALTARRAAGTDVSDRVAPTGRTDPSSCQLSDSEAHTAHPGRPKQPQATGHHVVGPTELHGVVRELRLVGVEDPRLGRLRGDIHRLCQAIDAQVPASSRRIH